MSVAARITRLERGQRWEPDCPAGADGRRIAIIRAGDPVPVCPKCGRRAGDGAPGIVVIEVCPPAGEGPA